MPIQKIYRNGNSAAVTIPKEYLEELNLSTGSPVVIEKKGQLILVRPRQRVASSGVDPKFMQMVDDFASEHEDVLRQLANK